MITAAHCLPELPLCEGLSTLQNRTYERFLSRLGQEQEVWAEPLFADAAGDVAVLGPPNPMELHEQYVVYETLMKAAIPLQVADVLPEKERPAWVLSLDGGWFPVAVTQYCNPGPLVLSDSAEDITGGMPPRLVVVRRPIAEPSSTTIGDPDAPALACVAIARLAFTVALALLVVCFPLV